MNKLENCPEKPKKKIEKKMQVRARQSPCQPRLQGALSLAQRVRNTGLHGK